jgi:hypothetical protein
MGNFTISILHQNICQQVSGQKYIVMDYYSDMDTKTKFQTGTCTSLIANFHARRALSPGGF